VIKNVQMEFRTTSPNSSIRWSSATATKVAVLALLTGLIVWGTFSRIFTVATGIADISHYYYSALDLLEASSWGERLQAALTWAPLHPLLLASIIHLVGAEWTYFLNPIVVWALLFCLGIWGWKMSNSFRCGVLTALAGAVLLLFGSDHQVYFLLYPFREALSFLFLVWGMICVLLAYPEGRRSRPFWLVGAGCGYVLAAAVREPAILAITGAVTYVIVQPVRPLRRKGIELAALLAPLLGALIILVGIYAHMGLMGSRQFSGWKNMVSGQSFSAWLNMYGRYVRWLCHLLGPWGIAASAVGFLWMVRRNKAAVLLLVLSMISTLALYATFVFHARYAVSAALFLTPFLGCGFEAGVRAVTRLGGGSRRWPGTVAIVVVTAGLLGICLVKAVGLIPWSGVTRAQLRRFDQTLNACIQPSEEILTDSRSRLLNEVLRIYLRVRPHIRFYPPAADKGVSHLLFLQPANEAAVMDAKVQISAVSMEAEILSYADLEPVPDEDGRPLILTLGPSEYAVFRLQPWNRKYIEQVMTPDDIIGGLIWLDFQQSNKDATRDIQLVDHGSNVLKQWSITKGNGLIPLYVGESFSLNSVRLLVSSSAPLPSRLLARPVHDRSRIGFRLGEGRNTSILQWLEPPTYIASGDKWAAGFGVSARFVFPAPRGVNGRTIHLVIRAGPRKPLNQMAIFHYFINEMEVATITNRLDRGWFWNEVAICLPNDSENIPVDLKVDVPPGWDDHFRVAGLGVRIEEPD